ncbi:MAG: hypothetical protein HUU02_04130 [Bacteroidetes bacterium]|nr:hypothetical protein [Bacteroidota bacterium]
MKHSIYRFLTAAVVILALGLAGCSEEDSPTSSTPKKPTVPQASFSGPNTTSNNEFVQQAKFSSSFFNVYGEMFKSFATLPGTQNGNVWTYSETSNGLTVTVTTTLLSDGSYTWSIVMNGQYVDDDTTVTVNNWKAFEGTSSADGKTGTWRMHDYNSSTPILDMNWATNAAGVESGSMSFYEKGTIISQVDIVNNPNGSGSLTTFEKGTTALYKRMELLWNPDGTGSYKIYNEAGVVTEQGTF